MMGDERILSDEGVSEVLLGNARENEACGAVDDELSIYAAGCSPMIVHKAQNPRVSYVIVEIGCPLWLQ